jgi:hypothetical protein
MGIELYPESGYRGNYGKPEPERVASLECIALILAVFALSAVLVGLECKRAIGANYGRNLHRCRA